MAMGRSLSQGGSHLTLHRVAEGVTEDDRGVEMLALSTVISLVSE